MILSNKHSMWPFAYIRWFNFENQLCIFAHKTFKTIWKRLQPMNSPVELQCCLDSGNRLTESERGSERVCPPQRTGVCSCIREHHQACSFQCAQSGHVSGGQPGQLAVASVTVRCHGKLERAFSGFPFSPVCKREIKRFSVFPRS